MKKLHLIIVFVFVVFTASPQMVTTYNMANAGLSVDRIASITEINNDIWIGEGKGISRFDGNSWENFSWQVMNAPWDWIWIHKILNDADGNIWACGEAGLFKYNGVDWSYFGEGMPELSEGYMFLDMLIDDAGIIWLLGGNTVWSYIYSFNPLASTWVLYDRNEYPLLNNTIWSLKLNSEGAIILVADEVGFLEFDGETFVAHEAVTTYDFAIDELGNYYSGGYYPEHGLYFYDAEFNEMASYNTVNSLIPFDWIGFVDYNNQPDYESVWFAGEQEFFEYKGVGVYDQNKDFFLQFDISTGLVENYVQAFFFRENEAWMGTYNNGVMKMDFSTSSFLSVDTAAFVVDIQMGTVQDFSFDIINNGGGDLSYSINMDETAPWLSTAVWDGNLDAYEVDAHYFSFDASSYNTAATYETTFKIESNGGIAFLNAVMNVKDMTAIEGIDPSLCSIYPNPASNYLNLKSSLDIKSIKISSIKGQSVYESQNTDNEMRINVEHLPIGSYFIQIIMEGGVMNKHFVIHR